MKKNLFFLLFLSLFFLPFSVLAKDGFSIDDVSVVEKSGTITVDDIEFSDNTISSKISFNELNDFVTFNIKISNNTSKDYKLESITNNISDRITIESDYITRTINKYSTKEIKVKLKYDKELINKDKIVLNNASFKLNFSNEDNSNIIINPLTNNNLLVVLVLLLIIIPIIVLTYKKKNYKYLILLLMLIPSVVLARETFNIDLKLTDVTIKGRLLDYVITIDNGTSTTTVVKTYGEDLSDLVDPIKEYYDFVGWFDSNDKKINKNDPITGEMNIKAKFKAIEYNISYDLKGGRVSPDNKTKYTIEDEFTLKNPTKDGYTFAGWREGSSTELVTSVTIYKGTTGDKSFTAEYSTNPDTAYTVIHRQMNLSGQYVEKERETLHGATDTPVSPEPREYTGFKVPEVQTKPIKGDGSTTFTYDYEREKYTFNITDRTNIDTSSTANGEYYYDTPITIKAKEKAGYDFRWNDGNTDYTREFKLSNNTTLTPIYTARDDTEYTVIHRQMNKNGEGYTKVDEVVGHGTTDENVSPLPNDYDGFKKPATQTKPINGDGSTTFTYDYERNKYQLTLEDAEYIETTTPSGKYYYETSITLKAKTRDNYTFQKWSNGDTNSEITFELREDTTIKPIYVKDGLIVTFNPNGGSVSPTQKVVKDGDSIGTLPTPTKDGNKFDGWYTSLEFTEEVDASYIVNNDIEIYAKWIELPVIPCTFEGESNVYVNGQYTYRYLSEYDGWGVALTDKESTDPVTSTLCTTVNNKPIVSMEEMFYNSKTTSIDTSSFNTSKVIDMQFMFSGTKFKNIDLSNFDTTKVKRMYYMFSGNTELESVDLSNFNTTNLESFAYMFSGCSSLEEVNMDNWDLSNASSPGIGGSAFKETNIKTLSVKNWKIPAKFTDWIARNWEANTIEIIDVTGWDLSNVTDVSGLFAGANKLEYIKGINTWDTSNVSDFSELFYYTAIENINLSNWNTSNATDLSYLFYNCTKLQEIDLSNFDTSNVTKFGVMFDNTSSLVSANLDNWDVRSVTDFFGSFFYHSNVKYVSTRNWKIPETLAYLLEDKWSTDSIEEMDVTNWDLSETKNINGLFAFSPNLKEIKGLDTWNTSNITSMAYLFQSCSSLGNLDLSNWDTSNVENMSCIFYGTSNIEKLNLDNWDMRKSFSNCSAFFASSGAKYVSARNWKIPENATNAIFRAWCGNNIEKLDVTDWDLSETKNITGLFGNGSKLKEFIGLDTWDTSNITNMSDLFGGVTLVTKLDLGNWNTSNVENMSYMFNSMNKIDTLYLHNFDTSKVTTANDMFKDCPNLKTIYASNRFDVSDLSAESTENMFFGSTSIVGGQGTTYDSGKVNNEYARLDCGTSNPGYFSELDAFKISFNPNGGILSETTRYIEDNEVIGELPIPEREGYIFEGWFTDIINGVEIDKNTIISQNITYYAHWREE